MRTVLAIVAFTLLTIADSHAQEPRELTDQQQVMVDQWIAAGVKFHAGEFKSAIDLYAPLLESEKQNRQLARTYWCVLVDNLGMSYGITGDLDRARETFAYGIENDSTYPVFHYNMACVYAEKNDLDRALKYLRAAYGYRANVIKGEKLPDPTTDGSFQRFVNDPRFIAAMKEMKGGCTAPATIGALRLTAIELGDGASFTSENQTKGFQARVFYGNPSVHAPLIGEIAEKDIQSVAGPDGDEGSIMYFRFKNEFNSQGYIEALMWGEDGPTARHPELVIANNDMLVIISFKLGSKTGSRLASMITDKLCVW